jgi:FkbM family methyltransferase
MSIYEKCFEKHSFNELNCIDIDNFDKVLLNFNHIFHNDDGTTIMDVGCNGGSFVRILKKYGVDANIHCFEPHPVLSKVVKQYYPYIIMNEICLSNHNGEVKMNIPTWSVGLSSIIRRPVFDRLGQEINILTVPVKTLDTYCEENKIDHIDFIKIDVEGAEKMVLEGANKLLSSKKIKAGLFEVGQTLIDAGTSTEEICRLVENYGYTLDRSISENDIFFYLP